MSSSKDDSQKNSKLPHRPEGVQKADEEHTGFLKYNNKSEKDPLIELFDTLQTVKDKTDQNTKEHDSLKTPHTAEKYSFEPSSFLNYKWISFFMGIIVLGYGGWYWYQNGGSLPQLSKNESEREPAAMNPAAQFPTPAPAAQPQKTQPTQNNLGKLPDRKNLGIPTPGKTVSSPPQKPRNGSGFFPAEDPSPTPQEEPRNTPDDEPEPPPPPPHEEPTNSMDDLGSEEEAYNQDDGDSEDNIITADGENPDQNDPQPKKRRKKAAPQY